MHPALDRVYRKTERGAAALKTRSSLLPARGRTVLILVNGADSVAALMEKVGPDAVALTGLLLDLQLIEEVPPKPPRAVPAVATTVPTAVLTAAAIDPATAEATRARLAPLKREAMRRLEPQFGPDIDVICASLLAATTEDAYRAAMAAIESKLSIYLGRKGAQRMLDGLLI